VYNAPNAPFCAKRGILYTNVRHAKNVYTENRVFGLNMAHLKKEKSGLSAAAAPNSSKRVHEALRTSPRVYDGDLLGSYSSFPMSKARPINFVEKNLLLHDGQELPGILPGQHCRNLILQLGHFAF
jgi:hypothetical protein